MDFSAAICDNADMSFIGGSRWTLLIAAFALSLCVCAVDDVKPEAQQASVGETLPGQGEELLYDGRLSRLALGDGRGIPSR